MTLAGFALVAGFTVVRNICKLMVLGKDPCTGGFPHPPWAAEKVGMTQVLVLDGVPQGGGDGSLSYHICEGLAGLYLRADTMNFSIRAC
jgi:hypothetical protein